MNWHDYITVAPNIRHGEACITGTHVMVSVVLDSVAIGLTLDEVADSDPSLSRESVQAAVSYAADLARREGAVPSSKGLLAAVGAWAEFDEIEKVMEDIYRRERSI